MSEQIYSVQSVSDGLTKALHQYLEAQYHIWDENLLIARRHLLETPGVIYQIPALEATPFYAPGKAYSELSIPLAAQEILNHATKIKGTGIFPTPFLHQTRALEEFLGNGRDIIVATGTGSGKTESFLMPILGKLAVEAVTDPVSAVLPGCRALLLYPMNALVNDQLGRLRKLFGNPSIAQIMSKTRGRIVRFGMYTSRTPYPGHESPARNRERLEQLLSHLFGNISDEVRQLLITEGKWPAKDMELFSNNGFQTGPEDRELFSRQEMQKACPDILVTNYSMLEYMLLRPIERNLFEQTKEWLHQDERNQLTIVLDEAHMYRGAAGAEVAMLLRRLQSRLEVDRSKIRYVLTSASLGSSPDAHKKTLEFAADLTGLASNKTQFTLITGVLEDIQNAIPASQLQAQALAQLNISNVHNHAANFKEANDSVIQLATTLGTPLTTQPKDESELRNEVFSLLKKLPPANLLSQQITGNPQNFQRLAKVIFPHSDNCERSLEGLIALSSFGKRLIDERVFLPIRLHLFYRGFSGIHACTNANCVETIAGKGAGYLGRLFDTPMLNCGCGARVYELLTHRDCGAAFLRGYLRSESGDFLWHEPSKSAGGSYTPLIEAHFLVETNRDRASKAAHIWLHKNTGRIERSRPADERAYLQLIQPTQMVDSRGKAIVTFDGECPVCLRGWQQETKIMDLATKGEAPFAHLIRTQVRLQPPTKVPSSKFPNAGRKTLLFSDGRQKAARLARDIPREVERDVFRQTLLLSARELQSSGKEARLDQQMYVALLHVLGKNNLSLFDGEDNQKLRRDVSEYIKDYGNDLTAALDDNISREMPRQYHAQLLRQLGNGFYSLYALTLAYVIPTRFAKSKLVEILPNLHQDDLHSLYVLWIQGLLEQFGFGDLPHGVRVSASGQNRKTWSAGRGFSGKRRKLVESIFGNMDSVEKAFAECLASEKNGFLFLRPEKLKIELALDALWYQCPDCTHTSPVSLKGQCVNCGSKEIVLTKPEESHYLRARKAFWRDPVVRMLADSEAPFNIDVQEHTAQLSHRDHDDPSSTTEEFERRFRDILVDDSDTPVDVLSSTTTMEVGIDIGSLVAVGLRNIPPMRQNYQQRAGRTGRRGSAISTVVTYAQNSPYDHHYFSNPDKIISGDPPVSSIDIKNVKIIERHLHAVFLQKFFHGQAVGMNAPNNVFNVLGKTWNFYSINDDFSLSTFKNWIGDPSRVYDTFTEIRNWIPEGVELEPKLVAGNFIKKLDENRPASEESLDGQSKYLIEFLFTRGLLPSYAFPRDICALQIEEEIHDKKQNRTKVKIKERPQQSLNVALSEYAPGRLVVINKKTYRIGTVAASGSSTVVNRAAPLFLDMRRYITCPDCSYTQADSVAFQEGQACPLCSGSHVSSIDVIQPEVVFPEGGREIDELDDENIISTVTSAQLPVVDRGEHFEWARSYASGQVASAKNQQLIIVNQGEESDLGGTGFLICDQCGKNSTDDHTLNRAHERDYKIESYGRPSSRSCNGQFRKVFLGYSFLSDLLLLRIPLNSPLITSISEPSARRPLDHALKSLSESLVISASRTLQIDVRELNGGYRFLKIGDQSYADIFIYDTLSGGAGYAHLATQQFDAVIEEAKLILNTCACQNSCDKCLRHYGNRFAHVDLDRFLALDLLNYFERGIIPPLLSTDAQSEELGQLRQILELEGWAISTPSEMPLEARRKTDVRHIATYPALVDPCALPHPLLKKAQLFSTYELKQDLPGVFARVRGTHEK